MLAAAAAPGAFDALAWRRDAVLHGELWRLLGAHLVHGSGYHLTWNVVALVGLGLLFEPVLGRRLWPVLGRSALAVGAGLLLLDPGLEAYCGLSGVLNGLWVAGALAAARQERGRRGWPLIYTLCVIGGLAKILIESRSGAPIFTDADALAGDPVPLAHALGALAGALPMPGASTRPSAGTGSSSRPPRALPSSCA